MLRASPRELLTPAQMARADQSAISGGIPGVELMEAAGQAVARAILARWSTGKVLVACGPGNNGGDGFVIARYLQDAGWTVFLALLGEREALKGDAAWHANQWSGEIHPLNTDLLEHVSLVVDALFGAGLSRSVEGEAAHFLQEVARRELAVCAVDIPSGVDGASGQVRGVATPAALTVTFFRKKPGHLLLPGRELCGELELSDIGIPDSVLADIGAAVFENGPEIWSRCYPWPAHSAHKYRRGHVLVNGGGRMTGAARLVALAAARMGAGLVTVASPPEAWAIYASTLSSIMVEEILPGRLEVALDDTRRNALVVGPGAGLSDDTRANVLAAVATGRAVVLDADALSVFQTDPETLFSAIAGPCVLTPHDGEFRRLFSFEGDRLSRARRAAQHAGVVIVLKGPDTVIAEPGGRAVINSNAAPWLATAGAGDVLAGMIAGLLAQNMPVFEAACAAVWIHGAAGSLAGPGLISEDLPGLLPQVLRQLYTDKIRRPSLVGQENGYCH